MITRYIPEEIPSDYRYIGNVTDTYFDLYNVSDTSNLSGTFYRIFYKFDEDFYNVRYFNNNNYLGITTTEIKRSDDILARSDMYKVCITSLSIIIVFIFLINIFTSIIKRGGVFHD